jgi:hypothetical protein
MTALSDTGKPTIIPVKTWKDIHCSGCTDPDPLGGTHCYGNIEHSPEPKTEQISKKIIKQATDYSNLSQWIQMEIWKYVDEVKSYRDASESADKIIKQVLEDKNLVNNKIHKEGFDAGYKKGYKVGYMEGWLSGIKKH